MHWVDRGPEPSGLEAVSSRFTQEWVERYQGGEGSRPNPRWQQFHSDLSGVFSGLCGYCEEAGKGEIDHFKPVSKFPQLVYEWSNWVFACSSCNRSKSDKWPDDGYINPCSEDESEWPERFFDFDIETRELIPKANISDERRLKALQMIDNLNLNAPHHIKLREERLFLIEHEMEGLIENPEREQQFLDRITDRSFTLSSIARALLTERGFIIDD